MSLAFKLSKGFQGQKMPDPSIFSYQQKYVPASGFYSLVQTGPVGNKCRFWESACISML